MGKTLSLTVVAEGVETQEQEDFLLDSCDEMHAFKFSEPNHLTSLPICCASTFPDKGEPEISLYRSKD